MAGFRDTLNLPKTDFPMKADLVQREPARLAWWAERAIYRKLRERFAAERRAARDVGGAGPPVWLLHDGPPYSNAHLHMGTAANKIWKDAAVRQATLRGFDSPYVPGWDNHGMPIEIQVSKEFREKKLQPDRITLRKRCREYAAHWVGVQREEFERLGVWGEWERPYLTMSTEFEASILDTFARLAARGYVQRGLRSIHWCPTDRTALAEAEIEYQDDASPSVFVSFPLRRDPAGVLAAHPGVAAVAWTTTPWTLPANMGLMVDPDADYAVVSVGDRPLLVATARAEAVAAAMGSEPPEIVTTLPGSALVGLVFEGPWGRDSQVVDGRPFVTMQDGSGLVHMAPGHGKEDFQVGQRNGFEVLCPVDEGGLFTAEAAPFTGRSVLKVNDEILAWLRDRGRILASSTFTHSYPHCWRCRQPVIFRATRQWFLIIDHAPEPLAAGSKDTHRERALAAIESKVAWDPDSSKNRIRESVRGRPDWCLSRQRSWGVGIPAIYCEACGEASLDGAVMRRAAELTRERGSDAWYETPVDELLPAGFRCPQCGKDGPFRTENDILDVWFDSGSTHRAIRETHPELAPLWDRAFERATPGEGVAYFEGPDQHRGWFNSSLMVGIGLADRAPYTEVYTHGWVLDGQGRAMHKSQGNVISPMDVTGKSGAEIVRWWALATDWRNDVRVGDEILVRVSEAYRKVRNTFRFLLGNLADFDPARDAVPADAMAGIDREFLDFLRARVQMMRGACERLEFHRLMDLLLDTCTVHLSAVYLDVTKDRLYTLAPAGHGRRSAQTVLWYALRNLCVAGSPALVFTAEEVWQHHPALVAECESVHLARWVDHPVSRLGEGQWEALVRIREAVNAAIEPLRSAKTIATTQEAVVTLGVRSDATALVGRYRDELRDFLMVAALDIVPGSAALESGLRDSTRPASEYEASASRAPLDRFKKCERCWNFRADVTDAGLCGRCDDVVKAFGPRGES
ncbi:MAG: isoleucine--tRNA ligase [Candidatus Eisenbacteria bacterium]